MSAFWGRLWRRRAGEATEAAGAAGHATAPVAADARRDRARADTVGAPAGELLGAGPPSAGDGPSDGGALGASERAGGVGTDDATAPASSVPAAAGDSPDAADPAVAFAAPPGGTAVAAAAAAATAPGARADGEARLHGGVAARARESTTAPAERARGGTRRAGGRTARKRAVEGRPAPAAAGEPCEDEPSALASLPGRPLKGKEIAALAPDVPLAVWGHDADDRVVVLPGAYACVEQPWYGATRRFHLVPWQERNAPGLRERLVVSDVAQLRVLPAPAAPPTDAPPTDTPPQRELARLGGGSPLRAAPPRRV